VRIRKIIIAPEGVFNLQIAGLILQWIDERVSKRNGRKK
jgi:hypothetical protein